MESQRDELISNFCAITDKWDIDLAVSYLSRHNWDLSTASGEYFSDQAVPMRDYDAPRLPEQVAIVNPAPVTLKSRLFSIVSSVKTSVFSYFSSFFASTPNSPFMNYLQTLNLQNPLKSVAMNLERACNFAAERGKLLAVYVHDRENNEQFLRRVLDSREISMILNEYYVFYACFKETDEGLDIITRFSEGEPVVFALVNPNSAEIIERISRVPNKEELMSALIAQIPYDLRNNEIRLMNDRLIRIQQEKEFREAEKLVNTKADDERKRQQLALKEKAEAEHLKRMEEENRLAKIRKIGEEPQMGPGVSQITFRLPSGEKVIRRFLDDAPIEELYTFLELKGLGKFEIVTGFPAKVVSQGTVRSEGLNPSALMHVRSIQL